MAEVNHFMMVWTKFKHGDLYISAHAHLLKELWYFGAFVGKKTFHSLLRFSTELRSGHWPGHSRTLRCPFCSHSLIAQMVWLGLSPCWKIFFFGPQCFHWWRGVLAQKLTIPGCIHPFFPPSYRSVALSPLLKSSRKTCFLHHASRTIDMCWLKHGDLLNTAGL